MDSNQRYLFPYCLAGSQRRRYHRIRTLTPETREMPLQFTELQSVGLLALRRGGALRVITGAVGRCDKLEG